jgi:phosphate transport system substrate-binding protein
MKFDLRASRLPHAVGVFALFGAVSCASAHALRVRDPVGPAPGTATSEDSNGYLLVFSETAVVNRGDSGTFHPHTAFSVHTLDGRLLRRVMNHRTDEDQTPERVELSPGTYLARARAHGQTLELAVRIEAGRTTEVRLDRPWQPPGGTPPLAVATAPDGAPVGWHALAANRMGMAGELRYEGSSTVALFVRDAQSHFPGPTLSIDVRGESAAGRTAAAGTADIAGAAEPVATPSPDVSCRTIGYDAIAVIVSAKSAVSGLTLEQVRGVFGGSTSNWRELGGSNEAVTPVLTGDGSATRRVFRSTLLGGTSYSPRAISVATDSQVVDRVATSTHFIGQVSAAFVAGHDGVKVLAIDGRSPSGASAEYPARRPLNLCLRRDAPAGAHQFVSWALSPPGQRLVARRFAPVSGGL